VLVESVGHESRRHNRRMKRRIGGKAPLPEEIVAPAGALVARTAQPLEVGDQGPHLRRISLRPRPGRRLAIGVGLQDQRRRDRVVTLGNGQQRTHLKGDASDDLLRDPAQAIGTPEGRQAEQG